MSGGTENPIALVPRGTENLKWFKSTYYLDPAVTQEQKGCPVGFKGNIREAQPKTKEIRAFSGS